jgi:hypothetical protein
MSQLNDPVGIAALVAGGLALIALLLGLGLAIRVHRMRGAQLAVLGAGGREDLVAHADGLQRAFLALHDRVEEVAAHVDSRMSIAEGRLDGAIAYRSLVRYDAYGELSGHQSTTIALLDTHRNGVVISSIAHRDTARLYCKQVVNGDGELTLSPEEIQAVKRALAGEPTSHILS